MTNVTPGLTFLMWALLHLIDSGEAVTLDEARDHIVSSDILDWLATLDGGSATPLIHSVQADPASVANVQDVLERHVDAVSAGKVQVQNNGLCLLLGYLLNELQSTLAP